MDERMTDLPRFFHSKDNTAPVKESQCSNSTAVNNEQNSESAQDVNIKQQDDEESPYSTFKPLINDTEKDHTLVKSPIKGKEALKGSLVGFRDGVPGIYSGFQRVLRKNDQSKDDSNMERSRSKSSPTSESDNSIEALSPVRPPRRNRQKSGSDRSMSDADYDVLWQHLKDETKKNLVKKSNHGSVYSVLNEPQDPIYDVVEKDDTTVLIESSDVKDDGWVETGVRICGNSVRSSPNRPQSTVVLPLLSGDDLDSDSDSWATEFDDIESIDEDVDDSTVYEVIGEQSSAPTKAPMIKSDYDDLATIRQRMGYLDDDRPPLPPRSTSELSLSDIEDPDKMTYVAVNLQSSDNPPPVLPPLPDDASQVEYKRYQIIKCMLENERMYMATLHKIFKEYEQPLKEKGIISKDRIKIMFHFIHEIEQCHQLFNIALSGRMAEWVTNPNIGDIIYASFSKSTVLKAYSNFSRNFTRAMDNVKETCKLVPAFLHFLKNRLYRSHRKQTLYDLLKQPMERLPQLIVLVQELLKTTPFPHPDHMSLQMSLTELECLSETVSEKRRDLVSRHKVLQLDKYLTGLTKGLSSRKRYYIRHDDMLLCITSRGQVTTTKLRRLFMLNDLLICAKVLNRTKQLATLGYKRYKVKWCVPLVDVEIVNVGSGISINVDNKTTTTIKYTHPVSASPRPGAQAAQEKIEDLQHDLTVIGEIAGLVASLRGSHEVLNGEKVNDWYRQVREQCDYEIEMANMNWLELSLPTKDGRTTSLFNLSTPRRKLEWTADLENAKLRLSYKNNPGWYLPDEEGISSGGTAVLRRTLPLLSCSVPLFMVEQKYTIECILEVTHPHPAKPILWIFSGNDHAGQITLMEMSMSSVPHVIESFCACNSRISTAEVVREKKGHLNDPHKDDISIWCGTIAGNVQVFDGSLDGEHKKVAHARLKDSVVCLRHVGSRVFAGLADGTVACFRKKTDGSWDFMNPTIVILGQHAILTLATALGRLWCSCKNSIMVIDCETLGIETTINVNDESKPGIKHLVSYGVGVWVSTWKSAKLELYHAETFECLQTINVAMPIGRMKTVVDSEVQNIAIDKLYITSLLAHDGILWVGTDVGVILTYPLPRLGGVPQVAGRPCVSFHGHNGPVRCLRSFRVTRNLKQRQFENGSTVGKSLFYSRTYDDVDDNETDLDTVSVLPRLSLAAQDKQSPDSTSIKGEPFYFSVEPDRMTPSMRSDGNEEYKRWVTSFGNSRNPVDLSKPMGDVDREDELGYHSDESIDSETEFCFIEDRKGDQKKGKVNKSSTFLSVNIKNTTSGDDPTNGNAVASKTAVGGLPVVRENEFAEVMSQFSGFNESKRSPSSSVSNTEVLVSKTPGVTGTDGKGNTFPTVSTARKEGEGSPRLYRINTSDNLVYEQPVDNYVDIHEESKAKTLPAGTGNSDEAAMNEPLNVSRYYKYAPLPPFPQQPVEDIDSTSMNTGSLNTGQSMNEEENLEVCGGEKAVSEAVGNEQDCSDFAGTPSLTMDEVRKDTVVRENDESGQVDYTEVVAVSHITHAATDPELGYRKDDGDMGTAVISSSNVGDGDSEIIAGDTKDNSGVDGMVMHRAESTPKREEASRNGSGMNTPAAQPTPGNEEGAVTRDEMYTPLLPDKKSVKLGDVSSTSTLSGAGLEQYERDTALSSSLVRNAPEGYYATLVAASMGGDHTRRELLLQPWYVVTVGPGHLDFRKKQTRSSAKDFFKSFRSSDPEPQLLVWKITSG